MKNLSSKQQRILSGIIVAACIIPVIFFKEYIIILTSFLGIIAVNEVINCKNNGSQKGWKFGTRVVIFITFIFGATHQLIDFSNGSITNGSNFEIISWIQIVSMFLILLPMSVFNKKFDSNDAQYTFTLLLIIIIGFRALIWLVFNNDLFNGDSNWLYPLMFVVVCTFSGDTWAYVTGSIFGKHKMIPSVSPKKTWEGAIGALILTVATGIVVHFVFNFESNVNWPIWFTILIAAGIMIVGAIGDLVFSKIKRDNGIKDFSNLLPGHGGVLDRFDAMLFTATFFVFAYQIFSSMGAF